MEVQKDFKELLALFDAHAVEYVIVGAHALAYHGALCQPVEKTIPFQNGCHWLRQCRHNLAVSWRDRHWQSQWHTFSTGCYAPFW